MRFFSPAVLASNDGTAAISARSSCVALQPGDISASRLCSVAVRFPGVFRSSSKLHTPVSSRSNTASATRSVIFASLKSRTASSTPRFHRSSRRIDALRSSRISVARSADFAAAFSPCINGRANISASRISARQRSASSSQFSSRLLLTGTGVLASRNISVLNSTLSCGGLRLRCSKIGAITAAAPAR